MTKQTIIVFCAHSDDQIFGVGGTLAKYAKEGYGIHTHIFSFGELSHPWLKSHISGRIRLQESIDADNVVGGKSVQFFGVREGKFYEDGKRYNVKAKIAKIIMEKKPDKIFTHSDDDPHPDHKAVNDMILQVYDKGKHKCDVYTFNIWNFVSTKNRDAPKLVVDISQTFKKKIKALRQFRSQWMSLISLMPSVYIKAIIHGIKNKVKFAEVFRKIR